MPSLEGIEYFIFAGLGAIVGCMIAAVLAAATIWFPAVWPWVAAPIGIGAVAGLIFAAVLQ